jgi:hypothetical protein
MHAITILQLPKMMGLVITSAVLHLVAPTHRPAIMTQVSITMMDRVSLFLVLDV